MYYTITAVKKPFNTKMLDSISVRRLKVGSDVRFLFSSKLFETIHRCSFLSRDRAYAAVAFVGKDSYQLFHENIRNVKDVKLIVNFSDNSVRSGLTNPAGVRQLQDFAEIRNKEDLHAKLYIFC